MVYDRIMKVLAIDIGGTALKVAETTPDGKILSSSEQPSEAKKGGEYVIQKICEIISSYKGYDRIGISTAGQVDSKTGTILYANQNIPHYTGMEVQKVISEKFRVPVAVENDVNAAALGEAFYGVGKDVDDFLCLTYGTGVGGAIIINRNIYGGNKGVGGEFGHIIAHPEGRICGCGQRGCYEQYASTTALVRECLKINSEYDNGRVIFKEVQNGNDKIKEIVDKWIEEIVIGLVSLVHIFNPKCIILGGGILEQPYIINEINNRLYSKIMPCYKDVEIRKAALGNNAGVLGATHIVLDKKQYI